MKQSSIDFLVQKLAENVIIHSFDINEAKEIHKQEIFDAWKNGYREFYDGSSTPEQYYKETYEKD
jgi:hypothetical protein